MYLKWTLLILMNLYILLRINCVLPHCRELLLCLLAGENMINVSMDFRRWGFFSLEKEEKSPVGERFLKKYREKCSGPIANLKNSR